MHSWCMFVAQLYIFICICLKTSIGVLIYYIPYRSYSCCYNFMAYSIFMSKLCSRNPSPQREVLKTSETRNIVSSACYVCSWTQLSLSTDRWTQLPLFSQGRGRVWWKLPWNFMSDHVDSLDRFNQAFVQREAVSTGFFFFLIYSDQDVMMGCRDVQLVMTSK